MLGMPEQIPTPEDAAQAERMERAAMMVARYTEDLRLDAQHALKSGSDFLRKHLSAEPASDDELWKAMIRIGQYGHPDAAQFILSHIDVLQSALREPAKRQACLHILTNSVCEHAMSDSRTATVVTGLVFPYVQEIEDQFPMDYQLLLPVLLRGSPIHRKAIVARLAVRWRDMLVAGNLPANGYVHTLVQSLYADQTDVRDAAVALLQAVLPEGLHARHLVTIWKDEREGSWHWITANINMILTIERERPGQRVCETLLREFGIAHFGRYPITVLCEQFDRRNDNTPYGVVAVARSDHNNALRLSEHERFDHLRTLLDGARRQGFAVRIIEFDSGRSIAQQIIGLRRRYETEMDEGHRIGFGMLVVHGGTHSLHPGESIGNEALNSKTVGALALAMTPGAWVTLVSCSTGKDDNGVAAILSRHGLRVIAPSEDTNISHVSVEDDPQTGICIRPRYDRCEAEVFINGKRQTP